MQAKGSPVCLRADNMRFTIRGETEESLTGTQLPCMPCHAVPVFLFRGEERPPNACLNTCQMEDFQEVCGLQKEGEQPGKWNGGVLVEVPSPSPFPAVGQPLIISRRGFSWPMGRKIKKKCLICPKSSTVLFNSSQR